MPLIEKIQNVSRGLLQRWGPASTRRQLWDKEFASGRWDYIDSTPDDCVYPLLTKYLRGGSLLDLGCGSGNTGNEIEAESYSSYTGVDLSDVAVAKAQARSEAAGRAQKNEYQQSDIFAYVPQRSYDVILFRESIMYVPRPRIVAMLKRYAQYVTDGGVFVVRMCDREKYAGIADAISSNFAMQETFVPVDVSTVVLIFRA